MEWMGVIDPEDLDEALSVGRYAGLARALAMEPMAICDLVHTAGLGGRGGSGFPAGMKWKFLLGAPGPEKYLVLNADEGDPGAYVNRVLMESDPHLVVEGMAIAGHATGATHGYIYIRDEYPLAVARDDVPARQGRCREGLVDGAGEGGARVDLGTEARVLQHEVNLRTHPLESGAVLGTDHSPIQPEAVRADAGRERLQVEEVLLQPGDLEEDASLLGVPVERDEAVVPLHPVGVRRDGLLAGKRRREGGGHEREQGDGAEMVPGEHSTPPAIED